MARSGEREKHPIGKTTEVLERGLDGFERWLNQQDPMFRCGVSRDGDHCVVANYLDAETGTYLHHVSGFAATLKGKSVELPYWAQRLVHYIDREGYHVRLMPADVVPMVQRVRDETS